MKQQTVSWVRNISKTPAISGCGGLGNKAVARILCRSSSCVDLLLYNRCYSCCVGILQNQTDAELFRLKAAQATQHSYHKKGNKCGNLESRLIFGRPYRHQLLSWTVLLLSGCLFRFTFIIRSKDNVCFFVLWMTILMKHKQHHISSHVHIYHLLPTLVLLFLVQGIPLSSAISPRQRSSGLLSPISSNNQTLLI